MTDRSTPGTLEIPALTGVLAEPFSFHKLWKLMGFFGPAAVVASLSLGAGETIMVTGLGAWSEFGLLWLLVLSVITKGIFVTYLAGLYTAITGQPVSQRLAMLPGPRGRTVLPANSHGICGVKFSPRFQQSPNSCRRFFWEVLRNSCLLKVLKRPPGESRTLRPPRGHG